MDLTSREELEQALYNDGYQLASEIPVADGGSASLLSALEKMYTMLDMFLDSFIENASSSADLPDCKKGCAYCCHQAVFAQEHEFRYLKNWIFNNMEPEEIDDLRERAKHKKKDTDFLSNESRLLFKAPCPLLKDNACMAYAARPVACRIYLSKNLASCIADFYQPADKTQFPDLYELPLRLGRKLNEGFSNKLQDLGFSTTEFRMEEGLLH